ncbi:NAD(P)-dependent oxidoreductase [Arthrobacter sp. SDTb3-6]|uniref:NAD(P)-dependent oxidoreductase n=1 Tax=Arthrobacter sp. SDTb3-6 TaxID=2713571 RepID=UPI00159DD483|nr:NAD(P)H-binding protein [Arthrobacter sp. SDTb3-6]NVM99138.1 NAD(P)H-binding protein [Arthrobacter sp. SDTb3-6]
MKIAIFGATGMVGSQIAAEAVRRGHEVTAISRSGGPVPGVPSATPLAADQADAGAVAAVAKTNDAVVLATGPSRTGADHQLWLDATATAMANVGSTRTMVVGGAGTLLMDGKRLLDLPDFPEAYRAEALTAATALEAIKALPEDVNWTVMAPAPEIAPGERTGSYVVGADSPAGGTISTQDFALAMLDELETPKHVRQRFTAAN